MDIIQPKDVKKRTRERKLKTCVKKRVKRKGVKERRAYLNFSPLHLLAVTSDYAAPNLFSQPLALMSLASRMLLQVINMSLAPVRCCYLSLLRMRYKYVYGTRSLIELRGRDKCVCYCCHIQYLIVAI
jgi:hypothetical protein